MRISPSNGMSYLVFYSVTATAAAIGAAGVSILYWCMSCSPGSTYFIRHTLNSKVISSRYRKLD